MVRFVSDLRGGNKNRNGDELLNNNGEGRWVNLDTVVTEIRGLKKTKKKRGEERSL